MDITLLTR